MAAASSLPEPINITSNAHSAVEESPLVSPASISHQRQVSTANNLSSQYDSAWINWNIEALELVGKDHPPLVTLDGDTPVEKAFELLVSSGVSCLVILEDSKPYGLFDYADSNAFLVLCLETTSAPSSGSTSVSLSSGGVFEDAGSEEWLVRAREITRRAKIGEDVPVKMACDISQKNPLLSLPCSTPLSTLLQVFSSGQHRILLTKATSSSSADTSISFLISDRHLIRYLSNLAQSPSPKLPPLPSTSPSLSPSAPTRNIMKASLSSLGLGVKQVVHLDVNRAVVLDAMKVMSAEGIGSVALVSQSPGEGGTSVVGSLGIVEIGKFVIPSLSKKVFSTPLSSLRSLSSSKIGLTDGEDHYPVYAILPSSTLDYTIQKLLALGTHRIYLTGSGAGSVGATGSTAGNGEEVVKGVGAPGSPLLGASNPKSNNAGNANRLAGVVSVGDVLSIFARLAGLNITTSGSSGLRDRRRRSNSTASGSSSRSSTLSSHGGMSSYR